MKQRNEDVSVFQKQVRKAKRKQDKQHPSVQCSKHYFDLSTSFPLSIYGLHFFTLHSEENTFRSHLFIEREAMQIFNQHFQREILQQREDNLLHEIHYLKQPTFILFPPNVFSGSITSVFSWTDFFLLNKSSAKLQESEELLPVSSFKSSVHLNTRPHFQEPWSIVTYAKINLSVNV